MRVVFGSGPNVIRRRPGHALRPLPLGRIRRAAAARHLGPRHEHPHAAARREAHRHHQRRHDSRPRSLRRLSRGRRKDAERARRRAGRGNGLREPRRRDLRARCFVMAHRRDHARSRARHARAGRTGEDAVLESRRRRAHRAVRRSDRRARARSRRDAARRRGETPHLETRSRRARREKLSAVSR